MDITHKNDQAELFLEKIEHTNVRNRIPIGNGYALEKTSKNKIIIYRYGVTYKIVQIKEQVNLRVLVVGLIQEEGVQKSKLADALGISRQSIHNWEETNKKHGLEGLINSYKGEKEKERKVHKDDLPKGNKARQLEEDRRKAREEEARQQMELNLVIETGDEAEKSNIFKEKHDYEENRYAGSFIYWGIFQYKYKFMGLCESYLGKLSLVVYLFSMMLVQGIESIEQLKTVYKREFGRILGMKQLVSRPGIWEMVHNACSKGISEKLKENYFIQQAIGGVVSLCWLFIDGHFIPYYGNKRVHKAYYTQRDQMMPGQTEIYTHDGNGRVVYFEIQEGQGDLKEMMQRMGKKWNEYNGGTPPLIIADREAWGVEHFINLEGCRFVTWEKNSKSEELEQISKENFGEIFEINGKKYQVLEEKKTYQDNKGNSIELRRIIIWNKETNKRVACVSQDKQEDTITLARAMLSRWGNSENSFKHMGDRLNMHYNPVIDLSKDSGKQEIVNPKYMELKQELSQFKKELTKCEGALGRLKIAIKTDSTLRKSKKREELTEKQKQLKEQIKITEEALRKCPERIKLDTIAEDEKIFKEINTEGKNLWDIAQSLVWNSRKILIHLFSEFLPDKRDLLPALEAITKCKGWIKSTSDCIIIRLEPLDTPRFRTAQIQLCRALTEKNIRLSNGKLLIYDVGVKAKSMSKI